MESKTGHLIYGSHWVKCMKALELIMTALTALTPPEWIHAGLCISWKRSSIHERWSKSPRGYMATGIDCLNVND